MVKYVIERRDLVPWLLDSSGSRFLSSVKNFQLSTLVTRIFFFQKSIQILSNIITCSPIFIIQINSQKYYTSRLTIDPSVILPSDRKLFLSGQNSFEGKSFKGSTLSRVEL